MHVDKNFWPCLKLYLKIKLKRWSLNLLQNPGSCWIPGPHFQLMSAQTFCPQLLSLLTVPSLWTQEISPYVWFLFCLKSCWVGGLFSVNWPCLFLLDLRMPISHLTGLVIQPYSYCCPLAKESDLWLFHCVIQVYCDQMPAETMNF